MSLLPTKPPSRPVDEFHLYTLANIPDVIDYAARLRSLDPKEIYTEMKKDPATWSRIMSEKQGFATRDVNLFCAVVDNDALKKWLAHVQWKCELTPLQSALEAENAHLRAALAEKDKELQTVVNFVRETQKR